ncbi:hypothetical protein KY290_027956 [Solanum tuberosum]|uniref:DUF7745 domain-containing protein n=1 Tax=Solanum tuberosum TaxID=4113 RepID=A0ABQ7UGI4_SOLTU|nr:hypothetical protein KY290_027956 [Solanum tuberosum]
MDTFNSPNPQMVVEVNYKLRYWRIDIKRNREREICQLLGGLTYLIFVIPNPHLIRALLEFWDPVRMVFKFMDFDLAPTIEEISGFIDLPYHECEMMVPYKPSLREFLKSLGMKSNPTLPSLDLGWIHFDFLYSCFGRDDSYHSFSDEFECSVEREDEPRKTLVPMILAEIMRSLSACVDGRMFFEGCNILLQLWAIEHFYICSDAVDIFLGYGNKIDNHPRRMVAFTAPTMGYHTRSNDGFPSLPNENRKGKRKATNEKVSNKTIENEYPPSKLISRLEKKIRELEEEVSDMRGWAKLLLSVDPTLETNIDKSHVTSQATLQDNPPPTHPTFHPPPTYPTSQNQPSSIQMPSRNTHFPNYPYPPQHHDYASRPPYLTPRLPSPPLQAPQYQTPLHQVPWYCAPLILFQIPPYQMHPSQKPLLPYQKPTYPVHNVKTLTQKYIRKNLFNFEKRPIKIYTSLTESIDQFCEKLRITGHIAPISEIRINTRARWIEPSKVCAYHSGMKGHTIEECRDLKDKIQQLTETKIICLEDFAPKKSQQGTC